MLDFGLFGRIMVRIGPEGDEALRMGRGDVQTNIRMDGQIPPVFYRTSSPSGLLPKNKSSKDRTWSAVPVALLGQICLGCGVGAGQRPQRANVL